MDVQFTRNMIIRHEGWRLRAYIDSKGIPTIGVGYNLLQPGAAADMAAVGAPDTAVLRTKRVSLTNLQVDTLLDITLQRAVRAACAATSSFNVLPDSVQSVLTDMLFTLGPTRARTFIHFWAAIQHNDFTKAASQLRASLWHGQAPNRVADLIKLLLTTPPTLQGARHGFAKGVLQ